MKNSSLVIFLALVLISGCKKPKKLAITPNIISVEAVAGNITYRIDSNTDWSISDDADWLTITPQSGSGDETITASYTQSNLNSQRFATISVRGDDVGTREVYLTQEAAIKVKIVWTHKTDMPTARSWISPSASVVNDKIYVIGGTQADGETLSVVEEYDPAADTWSIKSPLINARWGHSSDVVGGKIYVMGGCFTAFGAASRSMEVYDPVSDNWESLGDMPTGRIGFGSCVVNDKIYVMGGRVYEDGGEYLTSLEVYDPNENKWTSLNPMPSSKGYFSSTARGNSIYAISGVKVGSGGTGDERVFKYDINTGLWSETTSLYLGRWGISSCLVDTLIICMGGYSGPLDTGQRSVEIIYAENDDIVNNVDIMLSGKSTFAVCNIDSKIYLFGGSTTGPPTYGVSNRVEEGVVSQLMK